MIEVWNNKKGSKLLANWERKGKLLLLMKGVRIGSTQLRKNEKEGIRHRLIHLYKSRKPFSFLNFTFKSDCNFIASIFSHPQNSQFPTHSLL